MNPHFIYNALGSAVELNDAGRASEATDYLRGFARLLRMVLDHSVGGMVGITEELEFLRHYLLLESKRVAGLTYAVEADPDLIDGDAELPALVVQPFVENAVWHGLGGKEGERSVHVDFTRNGAGIRCTITDNGVGRGRNGKADHRSLGMQLTEERLRLLARRIGGSGSMAVEDLVDADGRPMGTRVTLLLDVDQGLSFQHDQGIAGGR
jgi:LytS/YehU family sensor histidine kinase